MEDTHAHPGPKEYVKVAIVLAIVTAAEVGLYYISGLSDTILVVLLLALMVAKFAGVALYFMHLKFDNPAFSRFFIIGLALAITVFGVVLVTLGIFIGD
jgi:heme/copper-type cytochrome/quinol oxidase subunit 4